MKACSILAALVAAAASMAIPAGATMVDLGMLAERNGLAAAGFAGDDANSLGMAMALPVVDDFARVVYQGVDGGAGVVPTGIELRAAEFVGRIGRIQARDDYGPRGQLGTPGPFAGLDPAMTQSTMRSSTNRAKFSYQVTNLPGTIPEPERWAMLIVGFGLTGGAMRWRRRSLHMRRAPALARPARRRR